MNKRVIKWVILNTAVLVIMWYALVENSLGAGNVLKFITILNFILSSFALANTSIRNQLNAKGPSVPQSFNLVYGVGTAIFFAYYGWFWYASIDIITTSIQLFIYAIVIKESK